jgi:general stress protein 26
MQTPNTLYEDIQELAKLLKGIKVAMFTTVSGESRLVSRPLTTRDTEFDGTLWFFASIDSKKVHELAGNGQVNLAYANPGDGVYVSVEGRAEIVRDRAKIDQLWNETFDSLYFKGGKTDPNLVLIRVDAHTAECWTSSSTAIGRAFDFLKAKLTDDISALGEQKHMELKRA